jgi:hypothetical protein
MIHLGYEVGTGKPVEIPGDRHIAIAGQTQQSGKTTTLEALIQRSGLRGVAFVTKRGEGSFRMARSIAPYFAERADWQFVKALLESQSKSRMNFEAAWIIRACKKASTLADVQAAVRETMATSKRGLDQSICEVLNAYLDIVLPQIKKLPYSDKLTLEPGINVMDVSEYTGELQALVIRSVLEWVYQRESSTVVIIPEAWEFLPQRRGSPVLLAAEELIRKGAALRNYVWLDSQDLAGVNKDVLRQVGVWILGVQREVHETRRTLDHIPLGSPKPKAADVMTLGKGEFFVCYGNQMKRVYVQPAWVGNVHAQAIARGEETVASVEKIWLEHVRQTKRQKAQQPPPPRQFLAQTTDKFETMCESAVTRLGNAACEALGFNGPGEADLHKAAEAAEPPENREENMYKEKFEQAEQAIKLRDEQVDSLCERLRILTNQLYEAGITPAVTVLPPGPPAPRATRVPAEQQTLPGGAPVREVHHQPFTVVAGDGKAGFDGDALFEHFKAKLLADAQVLALLAVQPRLEITIERPRLAVEEADGLYGAVTRMLADGFFEQAQTPGAAAAEAKRRGRMQPKTPVSHIAPHLKRLAAQGFLTVEADGYRRAPSAEIVRK